jgi:hypothetical protein
VFDVDLTEFIVFSDYFSLVVHEGFDCFYHLLIVGVESFDFVFLLDELWLQFEEFVNDVSEFLYDEAGDGTLYLLCVEVVNRADDWDVIEGSPSWGGVYRHII